MTSDSDNDNSLESQRSEVSRLSLSSLSSSESDTPVQSLPRLAPPPEPVVPRLAAPLTPTAPKTTIRRRGQPSRRRVSARTRRAKSVNSSSEGGDTDSEQQPVLRRLTEDEVYSMQLGRSAFDCRQAGRGRDG